jgi:hypothetical protein
MLFCPEVTSRKRGQTVRFVWGTEPFPKTQNALKSRNRRISYSDAAIAAEWLNANQGTKPYERVLKMRHALDELGQMLRSLHQMRSQDREARKGRKEPLSTKDVERAQQRAELQEQLRVRHNLLNHHLSRYLFVPALAYDINSGIWRLSSVSKPEPLPEVIPVSDGSWTLRADENTAVVALARLAANGELYKVRLCQTCEQRWKVSEREIDRFCSPKCRDAFYATQREGQAEKQRQYRQRLKDRHDKEDARFQQDRKRK